MQDPHGFLNLIFREMAIGEEDNLNFIFFSSLSTLEPNIKRRSHIRAESEPSAGKTFLLSSVVRLFPEDMLVEVGGTTPKAWLYAATETESLDLRKKVFIITVEPSQTFYDLFNSILSGDKKKFIWQYTGKNQLENLTAYKITVDNIFLKIFSLVYYFF